MDLESPDDTRPAFHYDDDSASAYEDSIQDSSHDECIEKSRKQMSSPGGSGSKSVSGNISRKPSRGNTPATLGTKSKQARHREKSVDTDIEVNEDAEEWAAKFEEPSPEDIRSPPRYPKRKRRSTRAASLIRTKRMKQFYNDEYRELLNVEVLEVTSSADHYDTDLKTTQIGSSLWTISEKTLLFTALDRLGRDDLPGIAARIGSKSQFEVQEYILLLHEALQRKKLRNAKLLAQSEINAATEISEECCIVLERAGYTLAALQDKAEEDVEKTKWGDSWLVNEDVAHLLDMRRKRAGGEEELEEVLPAANLFAVRNWVELSRDIFMNPSTPQEEDNWESIAEPGESPGLRATALEDFYSLAVNFTRRLVSTVLFCTMSRLRAKDLNKIKHSEVHVDDVEAAVKILGLKRNSDEFWIKCARRCNLRVYDDKDLLITGVNGEDDDDDGIVSYDAVEAALRPSKNKHDPSSPRSQFSQAASTSHSNVPSTPGHLDYETSSDTSSIIDPESPYFPLSAAASPTPSSHRSTSKPPTQQSMEATEQADDQYLEALDKQNSLKEEVKLWDMLEQEPPYEIEIEEAGKRKMQIRVAEEDIGGWREKLEFWSEWEVMEQRVKDEEFERNDRILRRKRSIGEMMLQSGDEREDSGEQDINDQDEAGHVRPDELDEDMDNGGDKPHVEPHELVEDVGSSVEDIGEQYESERGSDIPPGELDDDRERSNANQEIGPDADNDQNMESAREDQEQDHSEEEEEDTGIEMDRQFSEDS